MALRLPLLPARLRWLVAGAVVASVVAASLVPLPRSSVPVPTLLGVGLDKWCHVLGYAAVAATLAHALEGPDRRPRTVLLGAFAGAALLGVAVEAAQLAVPGRHPSPGDAAANALGAAVAVAAWRLGHPAVRLVPVE